MTGFGQDGPLARRAGHDLTYLALTGALHAIGPRGGRPVPPLNLVADYGGGSMFLIAGVLAALLELARSGKGQVVDAAMIDGASMLAAPYFGFLAAGIWTEQRGSNLLDLGAPFYDTYEQPAAAMSPSPVSNRSSSPISAACCRSTRRSPRRSTIARHGRTCARRSPHASPNAGVTTGRIISRTAMPVSRRF